MAAIVAGDSFLLMATSDQQYNALVTAITPQIILDLVRGTILQAAAPITAGALLAPVSQTPGGIAPGSIFTLRGSPPSLLGQQLAGRTFYATHIGEYQFGPTAPGVVLAGLSMFPSDDGSVGEAVFLTQEPPGTPTQNVVVLKANPYIAQEVGTGSVGLVALNADPCRLYQVVGTTANGVTVMEVATPNGRSGPGFEVPNVADPAVWQQLEGAPNPKIVETQLFIGPDGVQYFATADEQTMISPAGNNNFRRVIGQPLKRTIRGSQRDLRSSCFPSSVITPIG